VLAGQRAATVLAAMVEAGVVGEDQATAARAEAVQLARAAERRPGRHFADWIADQVPGFVNAADRDLVVETTLDAGLQRAAETQVRALLGEEGAKRRVGEAAAVILAGDGAVRALVGGEDYARSQFNRAVTALRQPGSSFKPFVYLAALEAGMTPDSPVLDARITIGRWSPENFDHRYRGEVSLTDAMADSLNTATVRLIQQVGAKRVAQVARRLGITTPLSSDLGIALGTSETSLLEMTAAFAVIPARGRGVWPYGIVAIRDAAGRVLWKRDGSGPGQALAPETAAAMDRMMGEVVRRGTGKNAALSVRAAGKTGTSQDFRDAWFVGYAGGLAGGVWMGNDDRAPMDKVTGGDLPAKLWHGLMQFALGGPQAAARIGAGN
jgi:penicillin-binding protein 1A